MEKFANSDVETVFSHYPQQIRKQLLFLRQLILETATELDIIDSLEETLKWGEPAYVAKKGSTIRLGFPKSAEEQYAMYFHCKTRLVETFKELYRNQLNFDSNRAIVFSITDDLPVNELKHCISLSLRYHQVKHLPLLGA